MLHGYIILSVCNKSHIAIRRKEVILQQKQSVVLRKKLSTMYHMRTINVIILAFVFTFLPQFRECEAQTVTPQTCEQSIVTPATTGRFLWLPIQESAPEGKVLVIADGKALMEQNVRMAREEVDYYVALDLQPYQRKGVFKVCVQNVPIGSVCFSKLVQNDDLNYALKD